jgi:hypothetical protein
VTIDGSILIGGRDLRHDAVFHAVEADAFQLPVRNLLVRETACAPVEVRAL